MRWKPNVTVAAVLEQDGRFLMVREHVENRSVYNQPAGHLEPGENLVSAVVREVLEETGYHFTPQHLIGAYRWHNTSNDTTFLRFCFAGTCTPPHPGFVPEEPVMEAVWLRRDELEARRAVLRSPLVLACIDDYAAGRRYPLEILRDIV